MEELLRPDSLEHVKHRHIAQWCGSWPLWLEERIAMLEPHETTPDPGYMPVSREVDLEEFDLPNG